MRIELLEKGVDASKSNPSSKTSSRLKLIALATLTVQNALLALSMRYSRIRDGPLFIQTTAVAMGEVLKLITCLAVEFYGTNYHGNEFKTLLRSKIVDNKRDTMHVGLPSILYVVQNNLLYIAADHLDVSTYQVTYQLKILTTAIFSVLILKKQLIRTQWISLCGLVAGVALVQLSQVSSNQRSQSDPASQSRLVGFLAILAASVMSGFAGVYFEKMLKDSSHNVSVWMRNIQLAIFSIPLAFASCLLADGERISNNGFFVGYDYFVVYLVMLNAGGGLLVAVVVKYADNILKGFACSVAIVVNCIISCLVFDFVLTTQFVVGTTAVISAVFLYGFKPKSPIRSN